MNISVVQLTTYNYQLQVSQFSVSVNRQQKWRLSPELGLKMEVRRWCIILITHQCHNLSPEGTQNWLM